VQVLLCRAVAQDYQGSSVKGHSLPCALVALSMQTHRSTFSEVVVAVEHTADPDSAAGPGRTAEAVAGAYLRSTCLEMVAPFPLGHWANRSGRQTQCSLAAGRAWEGHLRAFHEHH
jgi:hypothetical protein